MRAIGRSRRDSEEELERLLLLRITETQLERTCAQRAESVRRMDDLVRYIAIAVLRYRVTGLRLRYWLVRLRLRELERKESKRLRKLEPYIEIQSNKVRRLAAKVDLDEIRKKRTEQACDSDDNASDGDANAEQDKQDGDGDVQQPNVAHDEFAAVAEQLGAIAIDDGPEDDDNIFPAWWPN